MPNILRSDPFDDFFRGFFVRPVGGSSNPQELPSIKLDVKENPEAYIVHAELPGVSKGDIHIDVEGGLISISAERKQAKEIKDSERVLRTERYFGKVSRSFQLSQEIDEAKTVAKFNDGVLELNLPKKATPSTRRIEVQ